MTQFKCAFCGAFFNSKKTRQECCSLKCRYKLMGQRQTMTLGQRFWPRVQKGEGCWEWTGGLDDDGYGSFNNYVLPNLPRRLLAHRVSWLLHFGEIPNGLYVLHRCDNPRCVRPDHLFLGTLLDNNTDMVSKGRQANGERVCTAKLTAQQVLEIRAKTVQGARQIDLATEYGIDRNSVRRIQIRASWKHV